MSPKNEAKLALVGPDRPVDDPQRRAEPVAGDLSRDEAVELAGALRSLPALSAPEDAWPRVRADFEACHGLARSRRRVAVACAFSILVLVAGWFGLELRSPTEAGKVEDLDAEATVEELASASRQLEEVLRMPQFRAPVLTAGEAVAIVELEDRLTMVDEAISSLGQGDSRSTPDAIEAVVLWSHRVELLDALVEARGIPLSRGNIMHANIERR